MGDAGIEPIIKTAYLQIVKDHMLGRNRHIQIGKALIRDPFQIPFRTFQFPVSLQRAEKIIILADLTVFQPVM